MTGLTGAFDTVGIYLTVGLMLSNGLSWMHGRFARNLKSRGGLRYLQLILLNRRSTIRFSSSALLSLTHNDHYLMILSRTGPDTYWGPVGGVLKRHGSSSGDLQEFEARPDVNDYPDDDRDCDLRLFVPGRKFKSFLDWYETSRGRETVETALLREMYEELGDIGLHVDEWFRNLRLPLARVYSAPPAIFRDQNNPHLWHYRLFVTVELEEPAKQALLAAVLQRRHEHIAFISHRGIASRCHDGLPVGFHADSLLGKQIDPSGLHVDSSMQPSPP